MVFVFCYQSSLVQLQDCAFIKNNHIESEMKISVITVVFNGEMYIEETILSVIKQNKNDFELEYIIIDGGSTDRTIEIIDKYKNDIDLVISEKDNGIYDAMNKGIQHATGDIIALLNADDFYLDNCLFEVVECFKKNKTDIIYANMNMIDAVSSSVMYIRKPKLWKLILDMNMNHPAMFVSKKVYSKLQYNLNYPIAADYDFCLKAKNKGYRFTYLDFVTTSMRNDGVSANQYNKTIRESQKVREDNLSLTILMLTKVYKTLTKTFKLIFIRYE